ncbi:MAG: four-helix bundle copper-binding protein [Gemmataceae bacterium]|nr:four-helix bundle copper-binding protein [Gemmataceae bacterium]
MDRRNVLGVLGLTAAGFATTGVAAAEERKDDKKGGHEGHGRQTAKTCDECAEECDAGFHHCHMQLAAGKQDHAKAEHLCVDTATVCHATAALCARVSPLMGPCCRACAECCDACAKECESLNDPALKAVIEACRKTAKECR